MIISPPDIRSVDLKVFLNHVYEFKNGVRQMMKRSLNQLTPKEDFILGTVLGYDICAQCKRYCTREEKRLLSIAKK